MDYLVYVIYVLLAVMLFWGAKVFKKKEWNDGFMSLSQTKALQGFCAICVMLHHAGQKTCAPWLDRRYIVHGLDVFVPIGYILVGVFFFCSGYGLLKSYRQKSNYLDGFFRRRILPSILAFYTTGLIFFAVRMLMGEEMTVSKAVIYITGLKLSNPNSWFVIALPIFYAGFYFAFKYCKSEKAAIIVTCAVVFAYTLVGTIVDHNDWWMKGEWWYNSVHFFSLGLLFARCEGKIVDRIKKNYVRYVVCAFIFTILFYALSGIAQNSISYYGEDFNADFKVLRRWVCLITQMAASCSAVFFVFMLGMKIKIGNKALAFMGTITLEFYLIHGLFIELFGYSFIDLAPSLYYIKNVFLFVVVIVALSIPSSLLLQKFHKWVIRKVMGGKERIKGR